MDNSRKLGCLLGMALGVAASGAQAQSAYYQQPYNNDGRYGYDDRYGNGNNDPYYGDNRYGNDDRYGGRRLVRCESRDQRASYCSVDTRGGVRLVNQLSSSRCVRGSTWGANSRGIWVSNGCRANFELGSSYAGGNDGYGGNGSYGNGSYGNGSYGNGYGRVFRCESTDSRTKYCNADTRSGVRLVRQMSRSSCIEGRSWGSTQNGVWVSRGCRGEFRTGDRGYDYGSRY